MAVADSIGHRLYKVIFSVQKKKLAVSEGGGLSGGGLLGDYVHFCSYFLALIELDCLLRPDNLYR